MGDRRADPIGGLNALLERAREPSIAGMERAWVWTQLRQAVEDLRAAQLDAEGRGLRGIEAGLQEAVFAVREALAALEA